MAVTEYVSHNYKVVRGETQSVRQILSVPGVASMHRSGDVVTVSHAGTPKDFEKRVFSNLGATVVIEHIPD